MRAWLALILLAMACAPDPGACDLDAAGELVYDSQGNPAFAGQAVIIQSCGGGGFCHSDTLTGVDLEDDVAVREAHVRRNGAPADLNFDLRPASFTTDENPEAQARLRTDQDRVASMAGAILGQIQSGLMPPGDVGAGVVGFVSYDRVMADGVTFFALPRLAQAPGTDPIDAAEIAEAQEIVRGWLACGAPVVERTVDVRLTDPAVGFVVEGCERDCIDVRWTEIYSRVMVPTCAGSECHDAADPAAMLDLSGGAMDAYSELVDVPAAGRQCGLGSSPPSLVETGNADGSLLLMKLEATSSAMVCGSPMPLEGNPLSAQRLCVIRAWISCGACPEADGGTCAACLDAARATCNVDLTQPNGCASSSPCANRYDLPPPE